jgi:prepilin-type processing-associated H-X9-DG protein
MRQIGLAVAGHTSRKGRLPGLSEKVGNLRATWLVAIMSDLDQREIYDGWSQWVVGQPPPPVQYISLLHCPSAGSPDGDVADNSYTCNGGFAQRGAGVNAPSSHSDLSPFAQAAQYPAAQPAGYHFWTAGRKQNGPFIERWIDPAVASNWSIQNHLITFTDTDFRDGKPNTLLISENLQAGNWNMYKEASVGENVFFPPTSIVWLYADETVAPPNVVAPNPPAPDVPVHSRINGMRKNPPAGVGVELLRPSSNHAGGVNVCFADGHTQYLQEGIEYHVYIALMTAHGRQSDEPYKGSYVLRDADFRD